MKHMDKKKHKAKIILPIVFSFIIIAAAAGGAFFYKDIKFYFDTGKLAAFQKEKSVTPMTDYDPAQGNMDDLTELRNNYVVYRETEPKVYFFGMNSLFPVADRYLDSETDISFYTNKEFANMWGEAFIFHNNKYIWDEEELPSEKTANACTGLFVSHRHGDKEALGPNVHRNPKHYFPEISIKAAKFNSKALVRDMRQGYKENEEALLRTSVKVESGSLHNKAYYTFSCETENGSFKYSYTDYTDDIALHVYYFYDHYYYEIFYLGEQDEKYNEFLELLESIDIQIPDEIRDIKASYYKRSE